MSNKKHLDILTLSRKAFIFFTISLMLFSILFFLCACNEQTIKSNPIKGFSASGSIKIDGAPLQNVTILLNGDIINTTNEHGIFLLTGLKTGDVISFEKKNYTFSPSQYSILYTAYDLNVLSAKNDDKSANIPIKPTNPDAPITPDTPSKPNIPDNPTLPIQPTEPDLPLPIEKTTLLSSKNQSFVYNEQDIFLTFCIDKDTEYLEIICDKFSSIASIRLAEKDAPIFIENNQIFLKQLDDTTINNILYSSYALNITQLFKTKDIYGFSIMSKSDKYNPSVSKKINFSFTPTLSAPTSVTYENNFLSWEFSLSERLNALEAEVLFYVIVNGVTIATTKKLSIQIDLNDFTSITSPISVLIKAVHEDYNESYSTPLKLS